MIYCKKILLILSALVVISGFANAQKKVWTLRECIDQALQKNITLNQNKLSNEINKINYIQSKANLYPNLNLTDAHSFNFGRSMNSATGQYNSENASTNSPVLSSSVNIFNGFRNTNLIKGNKLSYDAGNLDIEKMKNDLALSVIAAYMQVLFDYEAVDIAQNQIDASTEQVEYTRKYVLAGKQAESNLLQIQAQLATDKSAKTDAENQLQLAKVTLMQLMEIPVRPDFDIERPNTENINPEVVFASADIYNIAEAILPEVKSAALKTNISEISLRISRSELMPKLTLSGNLSTVYSSANSKIAYNTIEQVQGIGYLQSNPSEQVMGIVPVTTSSMSNYPLFNQFKDNFSQGISLNLSIPIFNNLQYKSDISKANIALQNARLNELAVKNQLRKNIEQAYTDQLGASKNFFSTKEQLSFRERTYKDMEKKYRAGLATIIDFEVEKSNYNKAVLAHAQAKYEYIFKTRVVAFYTGTSLTN